MTRALQKHIARRQDQTFADWFAELRELAGERWADVADQAPTVCGLGRRRDAGASLVHGGAALAKRAAPKVAPQQASSEPKRKISEIEKLVARWRFLEAEKAYQDVIA